MKIRACIFDLGGTIVDRYSRTPFISLKNTFNKYGIILSDKLIYKDMGMYKLNHIQEIMKNPYIKSIWKRKHGIYPSKKEEFILYSDFIETQKMNSLEHLDIIPETNLCINYLKNNDIKIGVTTGFNQDIMNIIKNMLDDNNILIDSYVSSTCLREPSRPHPSMILENLERLNIKSPKNVIKIDDTCVGIEEGKNAGCITVGVSRWSTYMKICDLNDEKNLTLEKLKKRNDESKYLLKKAKPDYLITTLNEIPNVIKDINNKFDS